MVETPQTQTPEQFQAEASTIRDAPFGAGETQLDRAAKIEAAYKKQYSESATATAEPAKQGDAKGDTTGEQQQQQQQGEAQAQPVEIDWQDPKDAEISHEVAGVRQGLQSYFGELGLDSQQATSLVGIARRYRDTSLTDAEVFEMQHNMEEELRQEWGDAFDANARAIRVLIKEFERRFKHADLDAAIENGLWLNPDINRALLEVAQRQDPVKGDLQAIRKELMTVNQGSPSWHELNRALEAGYKKLHGTGS